MPRKFLPTVDLWDPAINAAVRTGQMKLQRGQWVKCGSNRPSRFAGATDRTIVAAHPNGTAVSREHFRSLCAYASSLPCH